MGDFILNKAAIIERCLHRIKEEYQGHEEYFFTNLTKQDSILLNLERSIQATIDMATHLLKNKKVGLPQSTREIFTLLAEENYNRRIVRKAKENGRFSQSGSS